MNHEVVMWIALIVNTFFVLKEFSKSIRLSKKLEEVTELLEEKEFISKSTETQMRKVITQLQNKNEQLKGELQTLTEQQ